MSSLLAHLAAKFSDQDEVVATDALHFVLRESAPALKALQQLLAAGAGCDVPVARVSTQFVADEQIRPDLALFGPDCRTTAFVEAKFCAGLTDAQPVGYLRRLEEQGGAALLFVVPEERASSIGAHLGLRAAAAGLPLTPPTIQDGVGATRTPGGLGVLTVSWKQLLAVLTAACIRAEDQATVASLDQLTGLVARYETEGFGPMSARELTDLSVPGRVRSLTSIVRAVVVKGVSDGLIDLTGTRPQGDWTSAGQYLCLPHGNGWFGIDHDAWARYQSTPLWMWFRANNWSRGHDVRRALAGWEAATPPRMHVNKDDSVSVPVFILPTAERDEVIEDILRQLRELDGALATAGLVGGPVVPDAEAP